MQTTCIMRTNIYKEKIIDLLKKTHLLTISQIHDALSEADYSTVFRNVEQLVLDKQIKKVLIDNKSCAYELVSDSHDHFICNGCGKIEAIHMPHNSIKGHRIEDIIVRGSCNKCFK